MNAPQVHDLVGIGFGPANIALAIALEELTPQLRPLFLEARDRVVWQPEMLLAGSDIQNNPVRDLVTPRNPRSRYTFLNFLFEQGRLLEYLNLGLEFPLRKEYNQYISWVAGHFAGQVRCGRAVSGVEFASLPDGADGYRVRLESGADVLARAVVVAPGRTPYVPPPFDACRSDRVVHLTRYEATVRRLQPQLRTGRLAVVGGSQSAVELTLDLARRFPDAEVVNVTRNFGHRLKDTSPFNEASIMPEFVDYYFHASQASKDVLDAELRATNYSAADMDVLRQLHLLMYEQRLDGRQRVHVRNNTVVDAVDAAADGVELTLRERHVGHVTRQHFDLVVLGTGFRNFGNRTSEERHPLLIDAIASTLAHTERDCVAVTYDYRVTAADGRSIPPLYLFNLCESSHGISDAGSFSLLSLRAATVARSLGERLGTAAPALARVLPLPHLAEPMAQPTARALGARR